MKNISCYIIILLCAVNMPSHILCFAYLLAVATSLRQIMVLRFSAIFSCGLKCDYGASFHLQEGSFSMFNDWIYTSYCCTLHYPILFLECHLLWVEAFWIQTGAPHSCRADSSNSVDIVCKEVFPSKGWPFFTLILGPCSLSAYQLCESKTFQENQDSLQDCSLSFLTFQSTPLPSCPFILQRRKAEFSSRLRHLQEVVKDESDPKSVSQ